MASMEREHIRRGPRPLFLYAHVGNSNTACFFLLDKMWCSVECYTNALKISKWRIKAVLFFHRDDWLAALTSQRLASILKELPGPRCYPMINSPGGSLYYMFKTLCVRNVCVLYVLYVCVTAALCIYVTWGFLPLSLHGEFKWAYLYICNTSPCFPEIHFFMFVFLLLSPPGSGAFYLLF